jgi:phosphoserine aminotransferase
MKRAINFSAGPAILPEPVLEQAAVEMLSWEGSGMSVMEMSHRGKEFIAIADEAHADLRELLAVPASHKILFLQGGATQQFGMVPMNLLGTKKQADYINTGEWSKKAIKEAKAFAKVNIAASSEDANFTYAPSQDQWHCDPSAAYVHYCSNETIGGVEFQWTPNTGTVPLVVDASSHILSRPVDWSRVGLLYAGAQKNIGPAGLVIVIVREDLLGHALPATMTMLDYKVHADAESMLNTPPTYAMYIAGLVFKWIKREGGLAGMEKRAIERSTLLYALLDASSFYKNSVRKSDRSRMNVPFTLADAALDGAFLKGAEAAGMVQLKGHRSVGGMRASIYNAMPIDGVRTLCAYMREFERTRG